MRRAGAGGCARAPAERRRTARRSACARAAARRRVLLGSGGAAHPGDLSRGDRIVKISTRQLRARAGPLPARRPAEAARAIAWPIALTVALALLPGLALLHGLLYVALLPPWQTPDEPAVFEYAALVSELGRVPTAADRDLALERRIAESLTRQRFFEYLLGHPAPARDLEEARV